MGGSVLPNRIVVTGGSGGIGSVVTVSLANNTRGSLANIDLLPPSTPFDDNSPITTIVADITSIEDIRRAFQDVDALFGGDPPELLVCCAGLSTRNGLLDLTPDDLEKTLAVNVRGLVFSCQEAARRMVDGGNGGRIVVITSIAAAQGWVNELAYCATKGAQASLVQAMAVELGPFGIAVNAVAPGPIEVESRGMVPTRSLPGAKEHIEDRVLLPRKGTPADVAAAVSFVATDNFMTGQTIYVDGGYLATGMSHLKAR